MSTLLLGPPLALVGAGRDAAAQAGLRDLDGRLVAWLRLAGGKRHGALGPTEGEIIERVVRQACEVGTPVVAVLDTSGADVTEGVASLHGWGRVARALADASGIVPIVVVVTGACVSGPALLLGLADAVIMTEDAFAYVSGPAAVASFTGVDLDDRVLGGAAMHGTRSGVATLVAADEDDAVLAAADLLSYLPSNNLSEPPTVATDDPVDRACDRAAAVVPASGTASYDVRHVIADVVDAGSMFELRPSHAPNLVTALARIGGESVGIIANQPCHLAGTLDIRASQKGARFVQWCDAFGLPLVTLVDTPGFQPGKDLEWRGMIRHGAELVHAYAASTVPRVCVILRKAYGGAYIVMDSKTMGGDHCVAWPQAEIAVMGAPGAVQVLERRQLAAIADPDERDRARRQLEDDYADRYCTPAAAAERGYVDDVIQPQDTRAVVANALRALASKRESLPRRRHANGPL